MDFLLLVSQKVPSLLIKWFYAASALVATAYGTTFLLPQLMRDMGGGDADAGLALAATAVTTIAVVLLSGHITDRLGRMRSVAIACVLVAASQWLFARASAPGVATIFAGGVLGVGWGLFYSLGPVVLSQITPPDIRIKVFVFHSVFIMAGFGLAPVIAEVLAQQGASMAQIFALFGGCCLLGGIIFARIRKDVEGVSHEDKSAPSALSVSALGSVVSSRAFLLVLMGFLGASVFAAVTNFQTVVAGENGFSYGSYFIAYTAAVVGFRLGFDRIFGKLPSYVSITALLAIMISSTAILTFFLGSEGYYIAAAILFGIGYGGSYPVIKALCANEARLGLLPQTLQLFGLGYFIGVFGFPYVASQVLALSGVSGLMGVALAMGVLELLIGLGLLLTAKRGIGFDAPSAPR